MKHFCFNFSLNFYLIFNDYVITGKQKLKKKQMNFWILMFFSTLFRDWFPSLPNESINRKSAGLNFHPKFCKFEFMHTFFQLDLIGCFFSKLYVMMNFYIDHACLWNEKNKKIVYCYKFDRTTIDPSTFLTKIVLKSILSFLFIFCIKIIFIH